MQQRLLHDFYQIIEFTPATEGTCQATFVLNPDHPIFGGHFPGLPIVPGVCMLQMTKELLEHAVGRETRLVSARNMKFMSILDPNENNIVRCELKSQADENGQLLVESLLADPSGQKVFFKMKGIFCLV